MIIVLRIGETPTYRRTAPLEGFRLDPVGTGNASGMTTQLLIGLEAGKPGISESRGVIVDYHQGERPYRLWFPYAIRMCGRPVAIDCSDMGGVPRMPPKEHP
jgi:hypothetical protein